MNSSLKYAVPIGIVAAFLPLAAFTLDLGERGSPFLFLPAAIAAAGGLLAWWANLALSNKVAEKETELARAQLRYRGLLSATEDVVVITDSEGKILEANETVSKLLGYENQELSGHYLPDFAPTAGRQAVKDVLAGTVEKSLVPIKDMMLNQGNGEPAWFNGSAALIAENGSKLVQVTLRDITASKRQYILTEKEISFIHELSRTLPLLQDFDQMLDRILNMLSEALQLEGFVLVLAEPNDAFATICVNKNTDKNFIEGIKESVFGVLGDLIDGADRDSLDFNIERKTGIKQGGGRVGSQILLPLAVVNGLAGLFSSRENAFKKEDLSLFSTMVSGISSLYIAYKSYQQVQHLSVCDSLTSLYNRRKFFEELGREVDRVRRYHSPLSLVMLDIDKFKSVNDRYGHQMGDEVLKDLTEILKKNTRKTDIVARYGGEEFIIMLTETPLAGALKVARRIREAVEAAIVVGAGIEIKFTASLGVTEFQPEDTVDTLVAHTDEALYRAKKNGRNRVEAGMIA